MNYRLMTAILLIVLSVSLISVHVSFARITCCSCNSVSECQSVECYSKSCSDNQCVYREITGGSCAGGEGECVNGNCIIHVGAMCNENTRCEFDIGETCSCPDCEAECAGDLSQPPPPSGSSGSSCPGDPPSRYEDPVYTCPDGTGCLDYEECIDGKCYAPGGSENSQCCKWGWQYR